MVLFGDELRNKKGGLFDGASLGVQFIILV